MKSFIEILFVIFLLGIPGSEVNKFYDSKLQDDFLQVTCIHTFNEDIQATVLEERYAAGDDFILFTECEGSDAVNSVAPNNESLVAHG